MGKRINIYFSDEKVVDKLNKEENKSELITKLLIDYYNKDLDYLEGEQQLLTEKLTINKIKIDNITKKRQEIKELEEEKILKENEIVEVKELADDVLDLWKDKKITDKQYWSLFSGGKLNIKKARKLLK